MHLRFSFSFSYLLSSIEYPQLVSMPPSLDQKSSTGTTPEHLCDPPSLHCPSHHVHITTSHKSYSFPPLNKRKTGWSLFQQFLRDQYCFLLDSSSSSNKDTCFHMEKVRSLIKPIQPWTTAGKKKTKKRHAFANRVSDPYKKKRDEQENGVGDIIDQPTNKIKRRGSH